MTYPDWKRKVHEEFRRTVKVCFCGKDMACSECPEILDFEAFLDTTLDNLLVEVERMIEENIQLTSWRHTCGSHSDDFSDTEDCDCLERENAIQVDSLILLKKKLTRFKGEEK